MGRMLRATVLSVTLLPSACRDYGFSLEHRQVDGGGKGGTHSGGSGSGGSHSDGGGNGGSHSGGDGNGGSHPGGADARAADSTGGAPRRDGSVSPTPDAFVPPVDASKGETEASTDGSGDNRAIPDASSDASDADAVDAARPRDITYTDPTGRMIINVRVCEPSDPSTRPVASCDTPDDFVLVGGGAEILDNQDDPAGGAVLLRSSPTSHCVAWGAASVGRQASPFVHRLRVYSIGLRLRSRSNPSAYISASSLKDSRWCDSTLFPLDGNAWVYSIPSQYTLVGGGVDANLAPEPHFALTRSFPSVEGWVGQAFAVDPVAADAELRILAIGLANPIPDFGNISTSFVEQTVSCSPGHTCTSKDVASSAGGVVTSIGGAALFSGSGRYFSGLIPVVEMNGQPIAGVTVTTRDFTASDEASTDSSAANRDLLVELHADD